MKKIIFGVISFLIAKFIYNVIILGLVLSNMFPKNRENNETELISLITKCIESAPLFCELFVSAVIAIFIYKILDEIFSVFED